MGCLSIRFTSTPPWIQIQHAQLTGLFGSEGAAHAFPHKTIIYIKLKCMGIRTTLIRFMVILKCWKHWKEPPMPFSHTHIQCIDTNWLNQLVLDPLNISEQEGMVIQKNPINFHRLYEMWLFTIWTPGIKIACSLLANTIVQVFPFAHNVWLDVKSEIGFK